MAESVSLKMQQSAKCPECGNSLPAFAPKGLCPACALDGVLAPRAPGTSIAATDADERSSRSVLPFGDYELVEEIGRGGMGIVYRARQITLDRIVALKLLQGGQFASKQEILRFRAEAEAAANLQHPNIVGIHETGERDGHHYFSMDFVEGRTLSDVVHDGPLAAKQAAQYCQRIAEAIEYAHSKGILHRDLKPSNILLDRNDQPRITDFGLAKRARGDSGLTVTGQVLGSPNFMPPEQTSGAKASAASDVYGIGAILYYLVTGRPPFRAETIEEVLLLLRESEAVSIRLLNASVPRDLETICVKSLQKEPEKRYKRARELAEDLGRFIRGEPIHARPASAPEKLWRWACRKPMLASLILMVNLLAAAGISGIVSQWLRAERSAETARFERNAAQSANRDLNRTNQRLVETISLLKLQHAEDLFQAGDSASGVAHLAALLRQDSSNHLAANRLVSALLHRAWALPVLAPMKHSNHVLFACFSPSGRYVLSASSDGTAKIWDSATGHTAATIRHGGPVLTAQYSRDESSIVTASADGTAGLWNALNGTALTGLLRHGDKVNAAEFSRNGEYVLTASDDQSARIWDTKSGALRHELGGHVSKVLHARFSPDGEKVATGTASGMVRVWGVQDGTTLFSTEEGYKGIVSLAFSPDGRELAAACADRKIRFWNVASGEVIPRTLVHGDGQDAIWHIAFSPDGKFLLSTSEDRSAQVWAIEKGVPVGKPLRHESGVSFGEFSPDGRMILTTSTDNTTRLWDAQSGVALCQPLRQLERVTRGNFSPDGRRIVTASHDFVVQLWAVPLRRTIPVEVRHEGRVNALTFGPEGKSFLTASHDGTVRMWNADAGEPLIDSLRHPSQVWSVELSRDRRLVLTACADGAARVWNALSGRLSAGPFWHAKGLWNARFSPDGARIVTASADATARVWDISTGEPITPPLKHGREVWVATFSPDGRFVLTASDDSTARLWHANSGEPATEPFVHMDHVKWAEFSPDGELVVTASSDNAAGIWQVRTGKLLVVLQHPRGLIRATFSPDGHRVATASLDRTARIWDVASGQSLTPALQHDTPVSQLQFSPDSQRLLTGCWSGIMRIWDTATGRPVTEELKAGSFVPTVCFEPSGQRIAFGSHDGVVQIWDFPVASTPVPEAFVTFAEGLAGVRLSPRGHAEVLPPLNLNERRHGILGETSATLYRRIVERFMKND